MVRFCQFLLRMNQAAVESQVDRWPFLSDFERSNLRNLGRFREICDALPETHYPDAFHLWTAEVNDLDYFGVVDKRFLNAITKTSRISPRTKLMAPRDLIQDLGIMSLDALS